MHAVCDPATRAELACGITAEHARQIQRLRAPMVAAADGSTELRDWVDCLVRPVTQHLDQLGSPTWYARFCAQLLKEPLLHDTTLDVSLAASPALPSLLQGLERCLPELSAQTHFERATMARHLIVHVCAERESALAEGSPTLWSSWDSAAACLVDGVTGLWQAPVARSPADRGTARLIH
ncbi:TetR/AcrR family transcriptional regulator [Streptomyces sp. NPDC097610]|uniref:TetR/AcrR family transcriptional regulator n=1 Tax=Streptomyces sp. NPDC097610 TaxID=3157227 RepID=UPI00331750AE